MPTQSLPPIETIPRPTGADERALAAIQRKLTQAERSVAALVQERDQAMGRMYDRGYKQRRLAEIISHGSVDAGGRPLTEHAVQRALRIVDGRMPRSRR